MISERPPHPSEYIQKEIDARAWTLDDLALRMGENFALNRLELDFYFEVGPTAPNLLLGEVSATKLARAFCVSPQFFLNLHEAWRKAALQ